MIAVPAALLAAAVGISPADFAYAWPLALPAEGGAFQVELTPEIHEVLVDPALRDLAVFDASGKPVPVGRYRPPPPPPVPRSVPLPVFVLPRRAGDDAWDVRLRIERGPDRALRQLDAAAQARPGPGPTVADYLLDARRVDTPIESLVLSWAAGPGSATARFAVEGSEDLERWTVLVPAATVVALRRDGEHLERREIPLPPSSWSYLRLRALDGTSPGELRVEARLVPAPPPPERRWIAGGLSDTATEELPGGERRGIYTFALPGWFDVEAVRVEPVGRRALAQITVRSRVGEGDRETWPVRGGFTLVGAGQGPEAVIRDEATVGPAPRSKVFRLEAVPPFEAPPRFYVSPRPDHIAFLAEGPAPYRLAAGSGTARRAEAPIDDALSAFRARFGATWEPPAATPGAREVLAGERALVPAPAPIPWERWVLWAVLAGGAGLVVLLATRLLRPGARTPGDT